MLPKSIWRIRSGLMTQTRQEVRRRGNWNVSRLKLEESETRFIRKNRKGLKQFYAGNKRHLETETQLETETLFIRMDRKELKQF